MTSCSKCDPNFGKEETPDLFHRIRGPGFDKAFVSTVLFCCYCDDYINERQPHALKKHNATALHKACVRDYYTSPVIWEGKDEEDEEDEDSESEESDESDEEDDSEDAEEDSTESEKSENGKAELETLEEQDEPEEDKE